MTITRDNVRNLKHLMAQQKELEKQIKEIKAQIMEEAEKTGKMEYQWADLSMTISTVTRTSINAKELAKAMPEVASIFSHQTTFSKINIG